MMVTLNKTPTRPQPIFSSKDLAKEYRSPYIRASRDAFGKILARAAIGKEGHLRERTFGRVRLAPLRSGQVVARTGVLRIVESCRHLAPTSGAVTVGSRRLTKLPPAQYVCSSSEGQSR